MADGVPILDAGNVEQNIATDDVTRNSVAEQQQVVKLSVGADGAFSFLVSPVDPLPVQLVPKATASNNLSTATTAPGDTGQVAKSSAGKVNAWSLFNRGTTDLWFKFYNKATAPTAADTPVRREWIPAKGGNVNLIPEGLNFSTGISYRCVTESTDGGTTSPSAGDLIINVDYI